MCQHIAVEGRCHARRIVIGGLQHGPVLGQVYADQQATAGQSQRTHLRQQRHGLRRVEVADGRPRVEHQTPLARNIGRQPHPRRDVAAHGARIQARQRLAQARHRALQVGQRNIHAHEMRGGQAAAQRQSLDAVAGTGLYHHAAAANGIGNGLAMPLQQGLFGARGVVLGQARDGLEQF